MVYNESSSGDQIWTGYGYATGTSPSYTYTSVGPVNIKGMDKAGMTTDSIVAQRSTITGAVSASDTFPQTSWQRWTNIGYDNQHQKQYSRLYHVIPTSGAGSSGTNYDETDYGFDNMGRLVRVKNPGSSGTATRTVYDLEGRVTATWIGTNDIPNNGPSPACWCQWPQYNGGVDLVQVVGNQYDGGNSGGDNLLTTATQYQDGTTTRVWTYGYDFRDRRTSKQGPVDYYEADTFDNLDHITQVDRYNTTSSGNLISRRANSFDDLDRIYQTLTYAVTPSTGVVGNALTGNTWYDAAGNVVKTNAVGAGSIFNKSVYDGIGRMTARYVSYDLSEGIPGTYADAFNVTNDTVVQQSEMAYDAASNVIQTTTHERLNDATGTGALSTISGSQPKARVTNQVMYFDPISRAIASADYGTNGDAALTRPASIPTSSATILVSKTAYDIAGMAYQTTDPKGLITQMTFDNAGRKSSVVEDTGTLSRTTNYTYTPDNLMATITAVNAGTGNQVTTYAYGSTLTESAVASSTLLHSITYPDLGSPVTFSYNRLGETSTKQDNNGSIHSYDYDGLGRLVNDRVTTFGTGVDNAVKRITRTYEVRGMVVGTLSYDNATVGSGSVLNDDERSYNAFGQLATDAQSHSGAVVLGTSPQTSYAYDSGGTSNEIRPTSVTYPNTRVVYYVYNDAGDTAGISAAINRVTAISTAATRGTSDANVIAAYDYLGFNHFLRESYPTPKIRLDYWGGTSGTFTGFDNFSRVKSQEWVNYNSTPFDAFNINHGYDQDSNRLYAANTAYGSASQVYTYDTLNRLTQYKAGSIKPDDSDTQSYWTRAGQQWTLDVEGNQTASYVWDNGRGGFYLWNETAFDKANKPTGTWARGNAAKTPISDPFTSNTAANWTKPGSGDAFNVNSSNAGYPPSKSAAYAAATRWLIQPAPGGEDVQRWSVALLHGHGGQVGKVLQMEVNRETHTLRASAPLADRPAAPTPARATG